MASINNFCYMALEVLNTVNVDVCLMFNATVLL
jgi:hypothetical protein